MTNPQDTFNRDLKRGEVIEKVVLAIIMLKYPKAHKIDGYFKDYDIYIPEIDKSVEVKSDEKSRYTGNILVEFEFDGKPSALSTTKADYWVWYDGEYLIWFNTDDIKKCLKDKDNNLKPSRFIGKGDSKYKRAFLVKKDLLYKYAINKQKVDNI